MAAEPYADLAFNDPFDSTTAGAAGAAGAEGVEGVEGAEASGTARSVGSGSV
jgi:hypothetical protein